MLGSKFSRFTGPFHPFVGGGAFRPTLAGSEKKMLRPMLHQLAFRPMLHQLAFHPMLHQLAFRPAPFIHPALIRPTSVPPTPAMFFAKRGLHDLFSSAELHSPVPEEPSSTETDNVKKDQPKVDGEGGAKQPEKDLPTRVTILETLQERVTEQGFTRLQTEMKSSKIEVRTLLGFIIVTMFLGVGFKLLSYDVKTQEKFERGLNEKHSEMMADLHEMRGEAKADLHEMRGEAKADLREMRGAIETEMHRIEKRLERGQGRLEMGMRDISESVKSRSWF